MLFLWHFHTRQFQSPEELDRQFQNLLHAIDSFRIFSIVDSFGTNSICLVQASFTETDVKKKPIFKTYAKKGTVIAAKTLKYGIYNAFKISNRQFFLVKHVGSFRIPQNACLKVSDFLDNYSPLFFCKRLMIAGRTSLWHTGGGGE